MSLGPGLRCVSTTGGTATSERTFWSFWERVEEGNWKRYKIGDSEVVARRFRRFIVECIVGSAFYYVYVTTVSPDQVTLMEKARYACFTYSFHEPGKAL